MARTRKLRVCPFCGSTNLSVDVTYTHSAYVTCMGCQAFGPLRPDERTAIRAWETRVCEKTEDGDE